jgi:hypothetical protein
MVPAVIVFVVMTIIRRRRAKLRRQRIKRSGKTEAGIAEKSDTEK